MYDGGGVRVGRDQEQARNTSERMNGDTDQRPSYFDRLSMRASPRVRSFARWYKTAVEHADAWTEGQSARLGTNSDSILDAVRRGWLPEQIEGVTSKYALEDGPPLGARLTVISEGRVNHKRPQQQKHGWNREHAPRPDGETVMAEAFKRVSFMQAN